MTARPRERSSSRAGVAPGAQMIDEDRVRAVARLAHLSLSPDEVARHARELSRILEWVAKLDELDTSGIEPTAHAVELRTAWREDAERASLGAQRAIASAPERAGDAFAVPKILG